MGYTSGAVHGMLICVLCREVVARPVVVEVRVHLTVPKSAICQIAGVLGVRKDTDIKRYQCA